MVKLHFVHYNYIILINHSDATSIGDAAPFERYVMDDIVAEHNVIGV